MGPIRKFWRLSGADRALLFETMVWLAATRVALWLLPLRVIRRLLARAASWTPDARPTTERIAWAVSLAGRVVPQATCLPQALAAEALLTRGGYPAELRIGVIKTDRDRLVAHAWVESAGRIVVGDVLGLARYAPLPPLPDARV